MALRDCAPLVRPVLLQGRRYRVAEMRLIDIARLEDLAASMQGDPLATLAAPRDGDGRDAYHASLREAYDLAETTDGGGLAWGSPVVVALIFGTTRGATAYLRVALRRHRPRVSVPLARMLTACLTAAEWEAIGRVTGRVAALDTIEQWIDRELGIAFPPTDGGVPWEWAIAETCDKLGMTPDKVMRMTPSQLNLVRCGGRRRDRSVSRPKSWSKERFEEAIRRRREFWKGGEREAKG